MKMHDEPDDDKTNNPNPDAPPPEQPDGTVEGERLKAEAHDQLRQHRQQLIRDSERALVRKIVTDGSATIDDVRAAVPCPPGIDPRFFGAVPGPLAKCGAIKPIGITKTRRSVAHARLLTLWGMGDMNMALACLTDSDPPFTGEGVPA